MITVLHTESSMGFGGQEIRILREIEQMNKRGVKSIIAAQPGSGIVGASREKGIVTEEVKMRFTVDLKALFDFCRIIHKHKVDIVNTHSSKDSWIASVAAKIMRKPIVRTRHVSIPVKQNFASEFVYRYLCDFIMTTGEAVKNSLINDNHVKADKLASVPTGIDTDLFVAKDVPDSIREELGISKDDFVVGMTGFIRSEKGHKYLFDAVPAIKKAIPNAKFLIVGREPMGNHVEERIKADAFLKECVVLAGYREDIDVVGNLIDVFVQPSTGKEGVPQSLMQTLSMEKAAIATDVGAIDELIVDGETGFFIKVADAEDIAEKVITLYKDKDLRTRFGKAGRALVLKKFAISQMGVKIEKIYERLLGN